MLVLIAAVIGLWVVIGSLLRNRRDLGRLDQAIRDETHLPQSLHPVIDPNVCIGSLSCVKACPEGDILGIVNNAGRLIQGSSCIGHGRCALECPVDAIQLVVGSSKRGVDLPEVDTYFESTRPGVSIVGELGGMGLIRNATIQGIQAAQRIAEVLPPPEQLILDVVVVGAGPAGIAAGAALKAAGRRFTIIEQDELGGTVAHYPRHKLTMTQVVQIPGYGPIGKRIISKESLLEKFLDIVDKLKLPVRPKTRLLNIEGSDGDFVVTTDQGLLRARKVILAIGRRGTPRKLDVPGEDKQKVTYRLIDPRQYEGTHVLVVGGGDSAVEAAVQLANETDAVITISYRRKAFARCRAPNRAAIDKQIQTGRVSSLLGTTVQEVLDDAVLLKDDDGNVTNIPNDFVIVCAGGEAPNKLLEELKIEMYKHKADRVMPNPSAPIKLVKGKMIRQTEEKEANKSQKLHRALFILGLVIVVTLTIAGWEYYTLDPETLDTALVTIDSAGNSQEDKAVSKIKSLHEMFRPAGSVGHGIGVVASLVMLLNFLYPIRKRIKLFKGAGPINRWLSFHVFVGLMSPTVIVFHAAFQSKNLVAQSTFISLLIVVATGLIGRFAYGFIPRTRNKVMEFEEVKAVYEEQLNEIKHNPAVAKLGAKFDYLLKPPAKEGSLSLLFFSYPLVNLQLRLNLLFADIPRDVKKLLLKLLRRRYQIQFYQALRRFLRWWRPFHVAFAILLVVVMSAHIGVSLYLGFGWILF